MVGSAKVGVTSAWINSNNKMKPLIHSITICKAKLFLFGNELKSQVEPVLSTIRDMGIEMYDCGGPVDLSKFDVCAFGTFRFV